PDRCRMTPTVSHGSNPTPTLMRKAVAGWLMVGFALGGFFDGIVLHQILQWHHLLSGLEGAADRGLHFQITMDGLFHLLMYAIGLAGMILLLSTRRKASGSASGGQILRLVLIGFGVWHVIDAAVSYWLLGIHRIRMDSDMPLLWDIGWLFAFGIVPLILGIFISARGGSSRPAAAATLALLLTGGAAAGAGPRFTPAETIVVFRQNLEPTAMMAAVQKSGAAIRWTDASGT